MTLIACVWGAVLLLTLVPLFFECTCPACRKDHQ